MVITKIGNFELADAAVQDIKDYHKYVHRLNAEGNYAGFEKASLVKITDRLFNTAIETNDSLCIAVTYLIEDVYARIRQEIKLDLRPYENELKELDQRWELARARLNRNDEHLVKPDAAELTRSIAREIAFKLGARPEAGDFIYDVVYKFFDTCGLAEDVITGAILITELVATVAILIAALITVISAAVGSASMGVGGLITGIIGLLGAGFFVKLVVSAVYNFFNQEKYRPWYERLSVSYEQLAADYEAVDAERNVVLQKVGKYKDQLNEIDEHIVNLVSIKTKAYAASENLDELLEILGTRETISKIKGDIDKMRVAMEGYGAASDSDKDILLNNIDFNNVTTTLVTANPNIILSEDWRKKHTGKATKAFIEQQVEAKELQAEQLKALTDRLTAQAATMSNAIAALNTTIANVNTLGDAIVRIGNGETADIGSEGGDDTGEDSGNTGSGSGSGTDSPETELDDPTLPYIKNPIIWNGPMKQV